MSRDCTRNISPNVGNGPITDNDGLFRLAPIKGAHNEMKAPRYQPYRASKPTPVFQPIQITPEDLGFDNPAEDQLLESIRPRCANDAEGKLQVWFRSQDSLICDAIETLTRTGRGLDAYLFQDWLAHLHDGLKPYLRLEGRAKLAPQIIPLE